MDSAALLAFSARSAAVGEALWAATVRIAGGAPVAASVTDPKGLPALVPGGQLEQGDLVVRIRKEALPLRPARQQELQWKRPTEEAWRPGKWRVADVTGNECDAVWLIKCEPWN